MYLLAERVVGGRLQHGPKIRPELGSDIEIGGGTEENVLRVVIDACQLPQQVPDVGADAEVMQLPRIDSHPHSTDYIGAKGARGAMGAKGARATGSYWRVRLPNSRR